MNKILQIANIIKSTGFDNPQKGRVYSIDGISPCLTTMSGGGLQPKIIEVNIKGVSNTITTVQKDYLLMEENKSKGKLITKEIAEQLKLPEEYIGKRFRIRKLTPTECFRLMGVDDDNIRKLTETKNEKGEQFISNSQLYKMTGNSIVADVMVYMFRNLFIGSPDEDKRIPIQLNLF